MEFKMKILITSCSDDRMWYADMIGETVEAFMEDGWFYWSVEPAGHVNIIRKRDAEVVLSEYERLSNRLELFDDSDEIVAGLSSIADHACAYDRYRLKEAEVHIIGLYNFTMEIIENIGDKDE